MYGLVLFLLAGFELKHFIADYLLQTGWMIGGKGSLMQPGGYVHAGLHAVLSAVVLLVARIPLPAVALLVVGEFVVHYALDYAKVHYGRGIDPDEDAGRYWAYHGLDQLFHPVDLHHHDLPGAQGRRCGGLGPQAFLVLALAGERLRVAAGTGAAGGGKAGSASFSATGLGSTSDPRIWSTTSRSRRRPSACCCRSTR